MLLNEKSKFTDREIIEKDYLKLEDNIFNDMSLDDIYDTAKEYWDNQE